MQPSCLLWLATRLAAALSRELHVLLCHAAHSVPQSPILPPAVDQRAERVGRTRVRVGIYSLAVDEQRPWLMLTGGADPLLRLYDRRMLVTAGGEEGGRRAQQWVSCYLPSHLKAAVWDSGRHPVLAAPSAPALPGRHVTSVAFARGGAEVVGSYAGETIYSFDVAAHARDVEALLHIPDSVLRWVGVVVCRGGAGRLSQVAICSGLG